ncbi:Putative ferrochelatase [Rickettsia prowazekii str. Rp22]|nr:Putative ferrochelatase [Rickettsia prowazekii str. Rp22]AFE49677.1 ferrochelatase [Rickettsia prowazekii str. Chernikova]AFE50521.1 ferrochelatase [Rickettsia prowazekii str. Katsinyian]AFE51364.1 ferrochelatase [Rickettsia prowazekii str. BuV67-CWPP]AFE52203.1 ferrochelatase [Rickettsia prowazekii str. Dachau]AMS12757.1 ferrochelatase [Rickettsia prowazekii]EOB09459.1 Ferrochelatase [Rickettsia prowazekii str. Cairo 3]CAA15306.1 PROBABLE FERROCHELATASE (hemH) [Rickettsia prowazekii str.
MLGYMNKRIAIVLFNLGGPEDIEYVKPFLFNLFYDKAIINLPNPLRYIIAKIISITREKKSQKIYSLIGSKSYLIQETEKQKLAITEKLKEFIKEDFIIFINMRYSTPFAKEVIGQIKEYNPSEIILLPLYPQFSSTTTGSSVKNFLQNIDIDIPIKTICCYPIEEDFIKAHVSIIKEKLYDKNFRILFSAHGLPKRIIKAGDPYSFQIKETVNKIVKELNIKDLDYKITYQSRVGPIEWLKPNTEDEIELAGKLKKDIIIVPISFVSEHVETLVELDIEYKLIADKYKIQYTRIPTLGTNKIFINSLTNILLRFINNTNTNLVMSSSSKRICPNKFTKCLCNLTN